MKPIEFSPKVHRKLQLIRQTDKKLYQCAKDKGFGCTAHAGEYGSAVDVWQCVQDLGAARIGHGVRACDDARLMDYLMSHNICPLLNIP